MERTDGIVLSKNATKLATFIAQKGRGAKVTIGELKDHMGADFGPAYMELVRHGFIEDAKQQDHG